MWVCAGLAVRVEERARAASPAGGTGWAPATMLALCVGAFAAGLALDTRAAEPRAVPPRGLARLVATVEQVRHGAAGQARSRVRVISGAMLEDGRPVVSGTRLWVQPFALPERATVRLLASITPRVPFRNPTPHPPWPEAQPSAGTATLRAADAYQVVEHSRLARTMHAIRTGIRASLQATLDAQTAAVACALTLGDPDTLTDDDDTAVRASGMAHVFAVSGMHITLMAGALVALVRRALLWSYRVAARFDSRRIACALGVPLALFIAELTGASPSGYRAAVTSAVAFALTALGMRPHAGAVASFACLLFAACEPREALRPAYLLSIAATAAILAAREAPLHTPADVVRAAWTLSVRTTLATAPLSLWSFGTLSLVGAFANLLLVPIGSLLLIVGSIHALIAACVAPLAWISAAPLRVLGAAFLHACQLFASLSPQLAWPPLSIEQGVACVIASALLLLTHGTRARIAIAASLVLLLGAFELRLRANEQPHGMLRVTFVDVGQGDAALVDLPDGRLMLIDAGGNPSGGADPGERALVPLLRARRRDHIDIAVLTHPHPDHYGGLRAILENVPVGELWDTGQSEGEAALHAASAANELLAAARKRGVPVLRPGELCQRPRRFESATVRVLWPCPAHDSAYDENDNSFVVRIDHGQHAFLFTGDIEAHAEQALVASAAPLAADVLKVAHHGSRTSSSPAFVRAVAPDLAIISAGATNLFGHPHATTTTNLEAEGARVVDLGRSGGTIVTSDGSTLSMQTWAGDNEPETLTMASPSALRACSPDVAKK